MSDEVKTKSCESAVDMTAANTAARMKPENSGWNRALVRARKILSLLPSGPVTPAMGAISLYPIPISPIVVDKPKTDHHPGNAHTPGFGYIFNVSDTDESRQDMGLPEIPEAPSHE